MNKIIVMNLKKEFEDRVVSQSIYDFVDYCFHNYISFVVCNITEEEFKIMEQELTRTRILSERLARIKPEYESRRYMMTRENGRGIKIIFANYNDNNSRENYNFDYDTKIMEYNENGLPAQFRFRFSIDRIKFKIYTTETYEDVINHYKQLSLLHNKEKPKIKSMEFKYSKKE